MERKIALSLWGALVTRVSSTKYMLCINKLLNLGLGEHCMETTTR